MRFVSAFVLIGLVSCAANPPPTRSPRPAPSFSIVQLMYDLQNDDLSIDAALLNVRNTGRAAWEPMVQTMFRSRMIEKKWFAAAQMASAFKLAPEYFKEALAAAQVDDDWESAVAIACGLGTSIETKRATVRIMIDLPKVPQRRAMRRALIDKCPMTEPDLLVMLSASLEAHDERLTLDILTHPSLSRPRVVAALRDMFVSREVRGSTARHHLYRAAEAHCRQAVEAAVTVGLSPAELRTVIDKDSCEDDNRLEPFPPGDQTERFRAIHDAAMTVGNYRVALLTIHATKRPPAYLSWFIRDVLLSRKEDALMTVPAYEMHRKQLLRPIIEIAIEKRRFHLAAIVTQDDAISRRMFGLAIAAGKFYEAGEIAAASTRLKYSGPLDAMYAALRAGDLRAAKRIRVRFDISPKIFNASLDYYRPRRASRR